MRKRKVSIALICAPLLAALALCVTIDSANAEPHAVALIPDIESAVALLPASDTATAMHAANLAVARTSSTQLSAELFDEYSRLPRLTVSAVAVASVEATGSIPDRNSDARPPKFVPRTPPALFTPPNCVPSVHVVSLLATTKCPLAKALASESDYSDISAVMNARAGAAADGGMSRLRLALLPLKPLVLRPLDLPTSIEARIDWSGEPPVMIVGIASMYNPGDPDDRDAGDAQTASGEMYDGAAWTAAIRTDLRGKFGGVRYGRNYRPTYALVEADSRRAIIKINDVGPLAFGRVIDLNKRTMRYFDPSLRRGLIHGMRVVALPGKNWKPGPVDDVGEKMMLASAFEM